jgi:uncharacterized protein
VVYSSRPGRSVTLAPLELGLYGVRMTEPPPGYGAPPPRPGFNLAGGPQIPTPYANPDDRIWATVAHFGGIVVGFIAPLVTLLARGGQSPEVRAHSVEALNFQITWCLATIVASILAACTFGFLAFLPLLTWLVLTVYSIVAGVHALDGRLYRYPLSWRIVT